MSLPTKPVTALLLAVAVGGCSPSYRTSDLAFGDARGVYTNGNLRLITERSRPQPASGRILPTICTEPSPDYAIAFNQAGDLQATLAKLGNGNLSFASNEVASTLPGRNAGVLALRDGLYAACQSYVNGVIGHDAYALILSQYSGLVVELIQEQAATDEAERKAEAKQLKLPDDQGGGVKNSGLTNAVLTHAALDDATMARATGGATLQVSRADGAAPSPPAGADAGTAQARLAAVKASNAVFAAILVSCISEHDPTRIGGDDPRATNPMLSTTYCRDFLRKATGASLPRQGRLSAR